MSVKVLYTTHAIATGGRNGHTRSADGIVDVDLSIPKAMGGPGRLGATTPEDLFAAGYAACFCSAVEFVAAAHQVCPYSNATRGNIDVGLEVSVV
jgi:organic hydroperoxide reductase OsmC/OhrA